MGSSSKRERERDRECSVGYEKKHETRERERLEKREMGDD